MKYTAIAKDQYGNTVAEYEERSERDAEESALGLSVDYPACQIFVSWFRASDGQHGFYNPDHNHDAVGKNWNQTEE